MVTLLSGVLSIPVHPEERDRWYWRKENLGTYFVKSAYSLIQDNKTHHSTNGNSGFWRRLWNLKIPPKIKSFLWRACSECFPTKDLLRARMVQVNILCPVCNESPESILHCLVTCPFANTCLYKPGITTISGEFHSFLDRLQLVFQQRDKLQIHKSVTICWMVWKSQNDLVWNQHSMDANEVVQSAYAILNHWESAQDKFFNQFMCHMT